MYVKEILTAQSILSCFVGLAGGDEEVVLRASDVVILR